MCGRKLPEIGGTTQQGQKEQPVQVAWNPHGRISTATATLTLKQFHGARGILGGAFLCHSGQPSDSEQPSQ